MNNAFVRRLVSIYYNYSPPVAQFIKEHQTVRSIVRIGLMALIAFGYFTLHFGFVMIRGISIFLFGLSICWYYFS